MQKSIKKKKLSCRFEFLNNGGERKNLERSSWKSAEKRDGRAFDTQTAAVGIAGRLESNTMNNEYQRRVFHKARKKEKRAPKQKKVFSPLPLV